jgi:hypothetical protein
MLDQEAEYLRSVCLQTLTPLLKGEATVLPPPEQHS